MEGRVVVENLDGTRGAVEFDVDSAVAVEIWAGENRLIRIDLVRPGELSLTIPEEEWSAE